MMTIKLPPRIFVAKRATETEINIWPLKALNEVPNLTCRWRILCLPRSYEVFVNCRFHRSLEFAGRHYKVWPGLCPTRIQNREIRFTSGEILLVFRFGRSG